MYSGKTDDTGHDLAGETVEQYLVAWSKTSRVQYGPSKHDREDRHGPERTLKREAFT